MTAIIRRSPSRVLVAPFYRPTRLMEELETMAREMWDSWSPVTFGDSLTHGSVSHSYVDDLGKACKCYEQLIDLKPCCQPPANGKGRKNEKYKLFIKDNPDDMIIQLTELFGRNLFSFKRFKASIGDYLDYFEAR